MRKIGKERIKTNKNILAEEYMGVEHGQTRQRLRHLGMAQKELEERLPRTRTSISEFMELNAGIEICNPNCLDESIFA